MTKTTKERIGRYINEYFNYISIELAEKVRLIHQLDERQDPHLNNLLENVEEGNVEYTTVKELQLHNIIGEVNNAYTVIAESLSTSKTLEELVNGAVGRRTRARGTAGGMAVIRIEAELEYRARPGSSQAPVDGWLPAIHPIFHIPYLPGSSIKGVIRAAYMSLLEEANPDLDPRGVERCLNAIFGSSKGPLAGIGGVTVLDSYPEPGSSQILVKDVMTPHYQKESRTVVSEEEAQPTPIHGASIREGTKFTIAILVDQELIDERLGKLTHTDKNICLKLPSTENTNKSRGDYIIHAIWIATYHALKNMGIGSKTLKGYGTLKIIKAEYKKKP